MLQASKDDHNFCANIIRDVAQVKLLKSVNLCDTDTRREFVKFSLETKRRSSSPSFPTDSTHSIPHLFHHP